MRQQYHFRKCGSKLLAWDVFRLLKLSKDLEVLSHPLSAIKELDEPFWYDLPAPGTSATCRSIVEHTALIHACDLNYPIILCHNGRVMDGMHRVCKALMNGDTHLMAVRFSKYIEPDYVDVPPEDLPYEDE